MLRSVQLALIFLVFGLLSFATTANAQATVSQSKPSAAGRVSICKEIDDNWKCVGESSHWQANKPFNILFENPTPVGVDFIGMVFHRQDPSGKDVAFINEYQQQIGETSRKYATVGDEISLPAGTYSVYVIKWGDREPLEHNGNLTKYLAKTDLTVK
jgi:hypothetical protein